VVGAPGCGKSECIKTFAVAERERGKIITVQTLFTKAVESEELMGYFDPKSKYVIKPFYNIKNSSQLILCTIS